MPVYRVVHSVVHSVVHTAVQGVVQSVLSINKALARHSASAHRPMLQAESWHQQDQHHNCFLPC